MPLTSREVTNQGIRGSISPMIVACLLPLACCAPGQAADEPGSASPAKVVQPADVPLEVETAGMPRLSPTDPVWMDRRRKWVVVDGEVCLQRGTLEMFACPKGSKEHESVVATHGKPFDVHVGLIAIGAKPGKPVSFMPKYQPPTGTEIDIWLLWRDAAGKARKAKAQEWIRNVRTKKELEYPFVFAGSGFWKDPQTNKQLYQGNSGDFICVSNFPTATLDIPVESTQADASLLYEAFTERVPEPGTKVRLVLVPHLEE